MKPVRRVALSKPASRPAGIKTVKRLVATSNKGAAGKSVKGAVGKSAVVRGAEGFKRAGQQRQRQDEEYQRKKNRPYDFRLAPGDSAEVVILDKEPPFFVSLHKVQTGPKRWEDEVCIADTGHRCPLCESTGKEGQYSMVLTVLDRRPYKVQKGPNAGKTITVSKKLFVVKGRNLPKFQRQYEGKANGNFRGMKIRCSRDGEKDAAIGEDLEFLGRVPEAALAKYKENAVAAEYEKIFAVPTAKELTARYKLGASKVAGAEDFAGDEEEGDYSMDSVKW
jgi:hypothetical protein